MDGLLFVAGKSKKCANPECGYRGKHYHASRVLLIGLRDSLELIKSVGLPPAQQVRVSGGGA